MQQDFHYYACYALARAAGLNADAARTIATCSQFVDDACDDKPIVNEGLGHLGLIRSRGQFDYATASSRAAPS